MKRDKLRLLRNIGIAAHIDAGKTTLTERILYLTGKSHRLGETHTGNSQMDTSKQEIAKGITINSAATHTTWNHQNEWHRLNIIDTPGHVDFTIEVERSLRVLDGMVALFDAVSGVEPQTETVWQQASRYNVPTIAMVNKMDRPGADYFGVVDAIRTVFKANAIALHVPIGSEENFDGLIDLLSLEVYHWDQNGQLIIGHNIPEDLSSIVNTKQRELFEAIAESNEVLLEEYLDGKAIDLSIWKKYLRMAVLNRELFPVLLGAAYKNKGVEPLLHAICDYLPSPLDRGSVIAEDLEGNKVTRSLEAEEYLSALVFKIVLNEQNRQLSFLRVYSGKVQKGDVILNSRTGKKERIGRLFQIHANKQEEVDHLSTGDIGAVIGLKAFQTGDTICAPEAPLILENIPIPAPVISMAIEAKSSEQFGKLDAALTKMQLEDPSLKVKTDQKTGQTLMFGMGELHLEILVERLKDDFGLEVQTGLPSVAYQEVFTKTVKQRYRLKKQRGGKGMYAEIEFKIGPADDDFLNSNDFVEKGQRLQFINSITGGAITKEYIPGIEKGFRKVMEEGILAGYPINSLKVELLDGDMHSEDSSPIAFELCAIEAFRCISSRLGSKILEPISEVTIHTPADHLGVILGGINRRRGIILAQETEEYSVRIEAEVPLAEMFGYINHLRTVSSGRANYSMKFKQYALLPDQQLKYVLAQT